jgi:hypothetical protein
MNCELAFIETLRAGFICEAMLYIPRAAGRGLALVLQAGRRLEHGEKHRRFPANENRAFRVHVLCVAPPHRVAQCCAVLCCNELRCMWTVWWISALGLLFILLVHMWCDSLLAVRFRSAQTAHMGDVVVDKDEWVKLAIELDGIREDATEVNSFMAKHANKKWDV